VIPGKKAGLSEKVKILSENDKTFPLTPSGPFDTKYLLKASWRLVFDPAIREKPPMPPAPLSCRTRVLFSVLGLVLFFTRPSAAAQGSFPAQDRHRDRTPPVLTLTQPAEGAIVTTPTIAVRGTMTDESAVTLRVQGHRITVSNGAFSTDIALHRGVNQLEVEAQDPSTEPFHFH
jgi:hypothetical protein